MRHNEINSGCHTPSPFIPNWESKVHRNGHRSWDPMGHLSGWWLSHPSENMKVGWDYYSQYMEKKNVPNHQTDMNNDPPLCSALEMKHRKFMLKAVTSRISKRFTKPASACACASSQCKPCFSSAAEN